MTQTLRNRKGIAAYIATRPAPVIEDIPPQPDPANFCAEPEDVETWSDAVKFYATAAACLVAWVLFGWFAVTVWRMWV